MGPERLQEALALWREPGVRRYLWDNEVIADDTALIPLRGSEADFASKGFGLWGIQQPPTAHLVGFCGLRLADLMPEPELLFGLTEKLWGHGLAFEAASTVLNDAFGRLGLQLVGAATDVPNVRSIRLLERLGMRQVRVADHKGLQTLFYQLASSDWR